MLGTGGAVQGCTGQMGCSGKVPFGSKEKILYHKNESSLE